MENFNRSRYLQSVRSFYNEWGDRYPFFNAESQRSGSCEGLGDPFGLELWVEIEKLHIEDKDREHAGPLHVSTESSPPGLAGVLDDVRNHAYPLPRKGDRLEALSALRRYAGTHVLLKGRPGSGRFVTLVRLLLEEARKAEEDPSQRLPVLVEMKHFETSVKDLIAEFLMRHAASEFSNADIGSMLDAGELLLLVNGLDELPLSRDKGETDPLVQLVAFEQAYPSVPMIFTAGTADVGSDREFDIHLEMAPLRRDQVHRFVRKHVTHGKDRMLANVGCGRNGPATTPLFLSMLCTVFQSDKRLPESTALTYRRFTQIAFERLIDRLSPELQSVAPRFLSYFAFTMIQGDTPTGCRSTLPRSEVEEVFAQWLAGNGFRDCHGKVGTLLDELLEHGLIEYGPHNIIGCPRQSLRDYYAAEYLLKLLPEMNPVTLQQQYINCTKWSEPLALMAGLVEPRAQAAEVVALALDVDTHFGARLAGSVQGRYQQRTVSMVHALDGDPLHRILLLQATHSDAAVPLLGEFLRSEDTELRLWATGVLGEIAGEEAVQIVGRVLKDPDRDVQQCAAFALGSIGGDSAVQLLRRAFYDADEDLRRSAKEALATMPGQESLPTLAQALREPEEEMRRLAVEALGNVGGQQAVQLLGGSLKDSDRDVRHIAAQALGHIAGKEAVPMLLQALEDADLDVRCQAAEALGIIGSEEAVPALCQALDDVDKELRWMAAGALGKIGNEDTVQPLACALRDPDHDVRRIAAEALGNNGSTEAVQLFVQALKHGDEEVRWDLIKALRTIGTERAVSILAQALDDPDKELQWAAVLALGNMSPKQAVPLLLRVLNDPDEDLRQSVALQLGRFGCEEAVPMLLPALDDPDETIAWTAATALACIGRVEAVPVLSRAIDDRHEYVRHESIDCLGNIASKEVIPPLIRALGHRDEELRLRATLALAAVGSEEAVSPLIQVIRNLDGFVRRQVKEAEQNVSGDQETRPLDELLEEKANRIREAVAEALHQLACADVLATLRDVVTDDFDPFLYNCMLSMQNRLGIRNPDFTAGHVDADFATGVG